MDEGTPAVRRERVFMFSHEDRSVEWKPIFVDLPEYSSWNGVVVVWLLAIMKP